MIGKEHPREIGKQQTGLPHEAGTGQANQALHRRGKPQSKAIFMAATEAPLGMKITIVTAVLLGGTRKMMKVPSRGTLRPGKIVETTRGTEAKNSPTTAAIPGKIITGATRMTDPFSILANFQLEIRRPSLPRLFLAITPSA